MLVYTVEVANVGQVVFTNTGQLMIYVARNAERLKVGEQFQPVIKRQEMSQEELNKSKRY